MAHVTLQLAHAQKGRRRSSFKKPLRFSRLGYTVIIVFMTFLYGTFLGVAAICLSQTGFQTSAYGRIGETLWQCEDRYGRELGKEKDVTVFSKAGFYIGITFFDGKAASIHFSKERQDAIGKSEEMSDNEIQLLLDANSSGKTWLKDRAISIDRQWSTEDGLLLGYYSFWDHWLVISTKENIQRFLKAKASKEAGNLDGL
jgi:hypothetical protein